MTQENEQKKPESRIIEMQATVHVKSVTASARLLVKANLAKGWFADTVREAERETENLVGSVRREIVFAVCFAESYIFEWAREVAGPTKVVQHFSLQEPYEKLKDRWKEVPIRLYKAGLINTPSQPSIDWGRMGEVMKYRNGLVHGAASIPSGLPSTAGQPLEPEPTLDDLRRRGQGWALAAVLNVVEQLHRQTNTALPGHLRAHVEMA